MLDADQRARAAELRALHRPGEPVILPNAWDAASARAVEDAGFPAIATSSAAVAESLGYTDGEAAPGLYRAVHKNLAELLTDIQTSAGPRLPFVRP